MKYTAKIEDRNNKAKIVLLEVDGETVGNVLFNKPYRGVSCGQLRWMDKDFNRHEDIVFALASPESVVEKAEEIIKKYISN